MALTRATAELNGFTLSGTYERITGVRIERAKSNGVATLRMLVTIGLWQSKALSDQGVSPAKTYSILLSNAEAAAANAGADNALVPSAYASAYTAIKAHVPEHGQPDYRVAADA